MIIKGYIVSIAAQIPYDLVIILLDIYPKELQTYVCIKLCAQIFTAAVVTIAK